MKSARSTNAIYLVAIILVSMTMPVAAQELSAKVMPAEAKGLVAMALHKDGHTAFLELQEYDHRYPYYVVEWLGFANGANGYFDVNLWTGEVWDMFSCKKLTSRSLRKAQAEIRRRFMPAEWRQYVKTYSKMAMCMGY